MVFPEPVISQAIEPKTKADQEKMGDALGRLAQEDPTFRVKTDEETGQTIISGMGELHLEIIVDRMRREFNVEANVGKPQVAYSETIRKPVEERRQVHPPVGRKGQYGHVVFEIEPREPGKGFEFVDAIKGGVVPREFIPAVEKGVEDRSDGVLAGYPVVDVEVTLTFGTYHEVDSSEMAFKIAGSFGFKDGCRKAKPVILEPMMKVEVATPEDFMGNVMGDLVAARQGPGHGRHRRRRQGHQRRGAAVGDVRLLTKLRSITQGRATYSMEFDHYAEAPKNVADANITARGIARQYGLLRRLRRVAEIKIALRDLQQQRHARRTENRNGKRQIRTHQAARERGHDRSRGPRQDDADGGDHVGAGEPSSAARPRRTTRSTRRPKRRRAASRSTPRTSSTRPRTATTRTSTAPGTPTTSRT